MEMIPATIVHKALHNANHLRLHIQPSISTYSWIAGQWLDFATEEFLNLPRKQKPVGGYSFCSPTGSGTFELCVKRSNHPVSSWLFQECTEVGDTVLIGKASGTCIYPPSSKNEDPPDVVCLAGGVGITPLISIVRTANILSREDSSINATVYHAMRHRETGLLFESEIPPDNIFVCSEGRRINFLDVGKKHGPNVDYYVCGPTRFMDMAIEQLQSLGCSRIHHESWW